MAISSARFGAITDIQESLAAGASASSPISAAAQLPQGSSPAATRSLSPATTGTPTSCAVKIDGVAVLGAAGTLTVDLTNFVGANGATKTLAKLRGYHFENEAAADAGVNAGVTVTSGASNGQAFRGKFNATGYVVMPNSCDLGCDLNTAGVTVDATHKNVTFTAGSAGATFRFCFWGE